MFYVTRTVLVELAISDLSSQGTTGLSVCNNVHKVFWNISSLRINPLLSTYPQVVSLPPPAPPSLITAVIPAGSSISYKGWR